MFGDFFSQQKKKRAEMKEALLKKTYNHRRMEEKDKQRIASILPPHRTLPLHLDTQPTPHPEIPDNQLIHLPLHIQPVQEDTSSFVIDVPFTEPIDAAAILHHSITGIQVVYQYTYTNGEKVTGLGDFIRGCYFFMQFAEHEGIAAEFHIANHPLREYLEYFAEKPAIERNILKKIPYFTHNEFHAVIQANREITYEYVDNYPTLIRYINDLDIQPGGHVFLYAVNHPEERAISRRHKKRVREMFRPVAVVSAIVENALQQLNLVKHHYVVLHIRLEDAFFSSTMQKHTKEKQTNDKKCRERVQYIMQKVRDIQKQKGGTDIKFLLISNNNEIKKYILEQFPQMKSIFHEIVHIGEVSNDANMFLINTLKEFYLMSFASAIYSFSVYEHGSGFSKWCATTFEIPYVCYYLL